MNVKVTIAGIRYVNEIESYWTNQDYEQLLKDFEFGDTSSVKPEELREMLFMAITDFEPAEAAKILLNYKLNEQLNEGQIQSLSHEMIEDKVAEEYPEPEMHYDLFNVNQLLYKAYNGTFPNTEASIIEIALDKDPEEMTEEIMTKLLSGCLSEKSIIKRLYAGQIDGEEVFSDAAKFIWLLTKKVEGKYELLTSRYWIEKEDIVQSEYEGKVVFFDDGE